MESLIDLVVDWLFLEEMFRLYAISPAATCSLKVRFHEQMLKSLEEQNWAVMSDEWANFVAGSVGYRFCNLQARLSKGEIHLPSAQFPTCHTLKCPGGRILSEKEQVNSLTTTRTFGEFCASTDTVAISPYTIPGKTTAVSDVPSGRFAKAAFKQTNDD